MVQMIRKQVYIQPQQQKTLKRLSQMWRLSEAELIRQAIDHQTGGVAAPFISDAAAWEEAHAFMLGLCEREPEGGHSREWRREDLYDERMDRYGRHPD
jgi:hypothetical protein